MKAGSGPGAGSSAAAAPAEECLRLRRALARMSRRLYRQGLLTPSGGNLSVRLAGGAGILISPSGVFKGGLRAVDMVLIDMEGRLVHAPLPGRLPSIEAGVHAAVYRVRPDVAAVVHGHPPYATVVAAGCAAVETVKDPTGEYLGGVPCVPYHPPGSQELAEAVAGALTARDTVLLKGHGVFAAGPSLRAAASLMVAFELACQVLLSSRR